MDQALNQKIDAFIAANKEQILHRIIVWNFHSLLVMIQMCFSFMLTDSDCDTG